MRMFFSQKTLDFCENNPFFVPPSPPPAPPSLSLLPHVFSFLFTPKIPGRSVRGDAAICVFYVTTK